jgi:hypothetical protein
MLACLIACPVPQPSASHVRARVGLTPECQHPCRTAHRQSGQIHRAAVSFAPSESVSRSAQACSFRAPCLSARTPASTVTTWWPFRPEARTRSTTRPAGPETERIRYAQQSVTSLSSSHQPGPRPAQAPSTARQRAASPGSDPDPGPRLRHWPTSQYPMAVAARRLVSRHPSQYPEAHGPSVTRARLDGHCSVGPTRL